jgi:hypothetical protein
MARKEIIKALRNKVPVEYVREQLFGETGETGASFEQKVAKLLSSEAVAAFSGESEEKKQKAATAPGQRKSQTLPQRTPQTLRDHIDDVRGQRIARFLSRDFDIISETRPEELDRAIDTLDTDAVGLVADQSVNQRLLDRLAGKGLEFVAARDFKGVIKRPLSVKLMRIS